MAILHAGHGDPVPGLLLGVTFGVSLAGGFLAALADPAGRVHYAAAAVLAFATAYVVAETTPHSNALGDSPGVVAAALAVPAAHVALAVTRRGSRPAFLAVLYAAPLVLVAYLLVPA